MNTIAILHTQCGPYHLARVEALAAISPDAVDLIQLASHESQRQWVVEHSSVQVTTIATGLLESFTANHLIQRLLEHLDQTQPAVLVVAGYSHPAMRAAMRWGKRHRVPVVLLSDSQQCDRPRNWLFETIKGNWTRRHCDAAFVAGSRAAQYLETLGFPQSRTWRGYDVVDNNYFGQTAQVIRQHESNERQRLGLPERYLLYVGRFAPEKNLLRLLDAFKQYQTQHSQHSWSLVLVGSGGQEGDLKAEAARLGLKNVVWFGFKQIHELPTYYAFASALILPSTSEPWGLVVNEAMACSIPILASDRCGCVLDLVFPGINGYVFNPFDSQDIAKAITTFSSKSIQQQTKMGHRSQAIVANYSPEHWAVSLLDCTQSVQASNFH